MLWNESIMLEINNKLKLPNIELATFPFIPFDSRMYAIIHGKEGIAIDPADNGEVVPFLKGKEICNITILLTHEHFDHLTGVKQLRENFHCKLICSKVIGNAIKNDKLNLSYYSDFMRVALADTHRVGTNNVKLKPFVCEADLTYEDSFILAFAGYNLKVISTPGHSQGSCCICLYDNEDKLVCVFTGDSLMGDYPTHTNLPGGSMKKFNDTTKPFLLSLPDDTIIYPGHGGDNVLADIKNRLDNLNSKVY